LLTVFSGFFILASLFTGAIGILLTLPAPQTTRFLLPLLDISLFECNNGRRVSFLRLTVHLLGERERRDVRSGGRCHGLFLVRLVDQDWGLEAVRALFLLSVQEPLLRRALVLLLSQSARHFFYDQVFLEQGGVLLL